MSQPSAAAPTSAPESSLPPRVRRLNLAALFDELWELSPAPGSDREEYEDWLQTFCKSVRTGMSASADAAFLQKQVDRVFKEIGSHFDLASATAVDGFAAVFGPGLERRAEGSRKRPRTEAIPPSEPAGTGLGVPSQNSGPIENAAGPSKSSRAAPPPSRSPHPSQAEEEEVQQQVQPQPKKARKAKGKEVARDQQPVATVAVKSRPRRGEIPPQTNKDGTEARERDPEKVCDRCAALGLAPADCRLREGLPKCDKCHHNRKGCSFDNSADKVTTKRKGKSKVRQDKSSEKIVARSEAEDSGQGGQDSTEVIPTPQGVDSFGRPRFFLPSEQSEVATAGPSRPSRRVIPQVPASPLSRAAAQGFEGDELDKLKLSEEKQQYIRVLRQERELMYLRQRAIQEAIEANQERERELTGVEWGPEDYEPEE